MQLLLSHMFLSFMVRTSPLSCVLVLCSIYKNKKLGVEVMQTYLSCHACQSPECLFQLEKVVLLSKKCHLFMTRQVPPFTAAPVITPVTFTCSDCPSSIYLPGLTNLALFSVTFPCPLLHRFCLELRLSMQPVFQYIPYTREMQGIVGQASDFELRG